MTGTRGWLTRAATSCHSFLAYYKDVKQLTATYGEVGIAGFHNGNEITNAEFTHWLVELGVAAEFTPVDGAKRNGRLERKIALVPEGSKVAWLEYPRHFPDLEFPGRRWSGRRSSRRRLLG